MTSPYGKVSMASPVPSTVEQSMMTGARAKAGMWDVVGRALGEVGSAYFDKREEDKQIDAIVDTPEILEYAFKGRQIPTDPKEVRKIVKALYKEAGGLKGIMSLVQGDKAEKRAALAEQRQTELVGIAKENAARQKSIYLDGLRQRDLEYEALEAAYTGKSVSRERRGAPTTVGKAAEGYLGGLIDPEAWKAASGRLGHPLSAQAGEEARLSPSLYRANLEAMQARPLAQPAALPTPQLPPTAGAPTPQAAQPSYMGGMLRKAGEAIGGVEIPGKVIRETIETPAPIGAYSSEDFTKRMLDSGLGREHLPFIRQLAKEEGKPSMASMGALGIGDFLSRDTVFYNKSDAVLKFKDLYKAEVGRNPSESAIKGFLQTANVVDLEKVKEFTMTEFEEMGLDESASRVDKLAEARGLLEAAVTNPAALAPAAVGIARIFEPKGILTDEDITRLAQGDKSVAATVNRILITAHGGTMHPEEAKDMLKVLDQIEGNARDALSRKIPTLAERVAGRHRMPVEDVYKHTPLGELMPKPLDESVTEKLKTMNAGETVTDPVMGILTLIQVLPDGTRIVKDENGERHRFRGGQPQPQTGGAGMTTFRGRSVPTASLATAPR